MKRKSSTSRILLTSIISMVVCIAMLIGSTFAWFTDTVKSGKNKIVAGNLDIDLLYSTDMENWESVQDSTDIFDPDALWEPGHTEVVYFKIINNGSLALKYAFTLSAGGTNSTYKNVNGDMVSLKQFIYYGQKENVTEQYTDRNSAIDSVSQSADSMSNNYALTGNMEKGDNAKTVAIVAYMPTSIGNEANPKDATKLPSIDISVNLVATQMTSENDSFGNTYDESAQGVVLDHVTKKVTTGTTVMTVPNVSPANNGSTTVSFPPESLETDKTAELNVQAYDLVASNDSNFTIENNDGNVGKIDLNLKVDDNTVSTFNQKYVNVTTFIPKFLDNVQVKYLGDGEQPINVQYDSETGKLSFDTSHFSSYEVTAKSLIESDDTVEIWSETGLRNWACSIKNGTSYKDKTVKFKKDIQLSKTPDKYHGNWNPINDTVGGKRLLENCTIDGENHTISDMVIRSSVSTGYGAGFIGNVTRKITIKNLNFDNADVCCYAYPQCAGNILSVVLGYTYGTTLLDNVNVTNSVLYGYGKVAALVGLGADPGVSITFNNCSSTGNVFNGVYNVGGLAGNIIRSNTGVDNTTINNCVVENNTFVRQNSETYKDLDVIITCEEPNCANCLKNGTEVKGLYWVYGGQYCYGGYADYYISYGSSAHDCSIQGSNMKIADSEKCINK